MYCSFCIQSHWILYVFHSKQNNKSTSHVLCTLWHTLKRFHAIFLFAYLNLMECRTHSLEMLACIDRIASCSWWRFVGCTSSSTTCQRCSIGLRSGDCGGHFSTVNSLSCSKNQFDMISDLWHGALSCWK